MPDEQLTVAISRARGATVLVVAGELDLASAPVLEEALGRAGSATDGLVVLDLARLEFIDVAGIHVLIRWSERLSELGKRLVLINVGERLERVLG
jgi:anti-sigma B factor antagonist